MKPKKVTVIAWLVCIPLVALEIYGYVWSGKWNLQTGAISLGTFALVFVIINLVQNRRGDEKVEKDERTIRIANRALSYSWLVSILAVSGLSYLQYIEVLRMGTTQALGYIMLIMAFSSFAFRIALNRKGDVD